MTVIQAAITYSSSIDAISTLKAKIAYPSGSSNLPVVVVMHGFSQQVSDFDNAAVERFANYGSFVVFVEMRGRGTSGGSPDGGGREIQDIVDAVDYVLANYTAETDHTQIHIVGYSGGGANALSCAARFPDKFNTVTSFFGISDYGYDITDGWYQNAPSYRAQLEAWIGGTPTTQPSRYQARASVLAVANYTGGYLWLFHDDQDSAVGVVNTTNVIDVFVAANLTNYNADITTIGDSPRWLHNLPNAGQPVINAESVFMTPIAAKMYASWSVPVSGTLAVIGYVDTTRFSLWLGTGIDEFGSVTYNVNTQTYAFSATGTWTLTVKGTSALSSVTATINGISRHTTSNSDGYAVFQSLSAGGGTSVNTTIPITIDTMIYSTFGNNNYGAFTLVNSGDGGGRQRGLIRADLSSIPTDATVTVARLRLYCFSEGNTTDATVGVHRSLTQWYEGASSGATPSAGVNASTWNLRNHNGSVAWAGGAGGGSGTDYVAIATDSKLITEPGAWYEFDLLSDVRSFLAGTTNHGWWIINVDEATSLSAKRFNSSDSANAEKPELFITYGLSIAATAMPSYRRRRN